MLFRSNPGLVCDMLGQVANRGFNATPSKFYELSKIEGPYRGWAHHRWIYNKEGNDIVAYPKLNFLDHIAQPLDGIASRRVPENEELQWCWKDKCELKFINDDYLGPTRDHIFSYYFNNLIN